MSLTSYRSSALIEVDDNLPDDVDSTFGDTTSHTTSLSSSVLRFRYQNGRRYHAFRPGGYLFPNDEQEQDRLDIIHHMNGLIFDGKLFLAPIGLNPQRILDIGTGTGIWAIDAGDMFPSAEVLGNDLSPIQPNLVPPNVRFEVDDVEDDWAFKTPFDFIHCRYMATAIRDWPRLVRQSYEHLKPGGWVEFCDYDFLYGSDDGTLTRDLSLVQNNRMTLDASNSLGRDPCPGPKLKQWVEEAGFKEVQELCYKLPLGPWPKDRRMKEIGAWNYMQFLQGLDAWSLGLLNQVCGWSVMEIQVQVAQIRNEMRNSGLHAFYFMYVVYGQKPECG